MPEMSNRGGYVFQSPYNIGDVVHVAGDTSLLAWVTGLLWRDNVMQVELTWVHGGKIETQWVPMFIVQPAT